MLLSLHFHAEFRLCVIPRAGQRIDPTTAGRMREEGGNLLPSAHRRSGFISGMQGICPNGNQTGQDEESGDYGYRFHFAGVLFLRMGPDYSDYSSNHAGLLQGGEAVCPKPEFVAIDLGVVFAQEGRTAGNAPRCRGKMNGTARILYGSA